MIKTAARAHTQTETHTHTRTRWRNVPARVPVQHHSENISFGSHDSRTQPQSTVTLAMATVKTTSKKQTRVYNLGMIMTRMRL